MARKIKILHVLGGLGAGGIETWLLNVAKKMDFNAYQWDFMVFSEKEETYEVDFKNTGCTIYHMPRTKNPFKQAKQFITLVKLHNYDIVHVHRHLLSGMYFLFNLFTNAAFICHSHNTSTDSKFFRIPLLSQFFKLVLKNVKYKLACSNEAAKALYGNDEAKIIYYGIETSRFKAEKIKARKFYDSFLLPVDAKIIGHVGRFTEQKNHHFLLDIATQLIKLDSKYHFVLVGNGVKFDEIRQRIRNDNLEKNIHLVGVRTDVNEMMTGFFDVFLLPSLFEGFAVVLIEAECAAVPVVISDTLSPELSIIPQLVHRISLRNNAKIWADEIHNVQIPSYDQKMGFFSEFSTSDFSISKSTKALCDYYSRIVCD